eukprot:CFRG6858T1
MSTVAIAAVLPNNSNMEGSASDQERDAESGVLVQKLTKIEEEFANLKILKYEQKLQVINDDIRMLGEGTLQAYMDKVTALKAEKDQANRVADMMRKYRLESIAHIQAFEKKACENENLSKKKRIYDGRIQRLLSLKRKLEAEHQVNELLEAEIMAHNRRVGTKKATKRTAGQIAGQKRRKLATVSWPYIVYELRENEIQEDLIAIKRALKGHGGKKKVTKERVVDVSADNGQLVCGGVVFKTGCRVKATVKDTSYVATLVDVHQTEIFVNRIDGNRRTRINLTQLRQGKIRLEPVF